MQTLTSTKNQPIDVNPKKNNDECLFEDIYRKNKPLGAETAVTGHNSGLESANFFNIYGGREDLEIKKKDGVIGNQFVMDPAIMR